MALKATIYKALVHLADMDRNVYRDEEVTLARHPSETDVRVMVRLLVYALNLPESDDDGVADLRQGPVGSGRACAWLKDLTGRVTHWIELGQPEEKAAEPTALESNPRSVCTPSTVMPLLGGLRCRDPWIMHAI
jgi:uncharacterized protein YaeQ